MIIPIETPYLYPSHSIYSSSEPKYIIPHVEDKFITINENDELVSTAKSDVIYNHQYVSIHPGSPGAVYYATNVFIYNKTSPVQIMVQVQFIPDLHIAMVPYGSFKAGMVYNPYHMWLFNNHGCLGNIDIRQSEMVYNEYLLWCDILGRCYDPKHPLYETYHSLNAQIMPSYASFEDFHKTNEYLKANNLLPLYDPYDYRLYFTYNGFTAEQRRFRFKDKGLKSRNPLEVAYPMRIIDTPIIDRTSDLVITKKRGRPLGVKNKKQMCKIVDI